MSEPRRLPTLEQQAAFIEAMKKKHFENGDLKPSPKELKAFLDAQVPEFMPGAEKMMGAYQWAAAVCLVNTRTVRRWCSEDDPLEIPYSCWVHLQLAAGEAVKVLNPLTEQRHDVGKLDFH